MENKIVFSILIEIPDERLDNPGWWENGKQIKTDKSKQTKIALLNNSERIQEKQRQYANDIGADYRLFQYDDYYKSFFNNIKNNYPEISEYDIINFFKHKIMRDMAEQYNYVCYMDFDVIPNTTDCIFEAHNVDNMIAVAEMNRLSLRGRVLKAEDYNLCIRNPATKYWNTHALLMEEGHDPENDVFNTGIMAGSSEVIKKLDYFKDFDYIIKLMSNVRQDEFSMYPKNIQRVFGYDNETVFSFWIKARQIEIQYMDKMWHWLVDEMITKRNMIDPKAKLYHFINKQMTWAL